MSRVNLYGTVHKGLRSVFFRTIQQVAATDFGRAEEASEATAAVGRLFGFLREHAEHEDTVILPEIARLAPGLHADLSAEHARTEGLEREIDKRLARVRAATASERVSLGGRIHGELNVLAAEHLRHMDREEREANRVLWAHLGDEELLALHGRIVGSIPAARMRDWLELMVPAASVAERAEILLGLSQAVPPAAFGELTAPARAALGPAAWERTAIAAGL